MSAWTTGVARRFGERYMCAEDLRYISSSRSHAYPCTCNSLSYEPVSSVEGRWSTVEWVAQHAALLNGPSGQNDESAAEDTAPVELSMRKEMSCLLSYSIVVFLGPALLEADNVWRGVGGRNLIPDLSEAFIAERRDVLQTPAIER